MTYRIVITESARADLRNIREFLRDAASEDTAERFVERAEDKIRTLSFAPERNRIRDELGTGLRALRIGKYLAFYSMTEGEVVILRIIHGARDITVELFR